MQFTKREREILKVARRQAFILALVVVGFTYTGAFGTYQNLGDLERLTLWSIEIPSNWILMIGVSWMVSNWMFRNGGPFIVRTVISGFIAAIPGAILTVWVNSFFGIGLDKYPLRYVYIRELSP